MLGVPSNRARTLVRYKSGSKSRDGATGCGARQVAAGVACRGPSADAARLVDDLVDSRWTITVAAWLLRSSGVSAVYPLALAQAGFDE